MATIAQQEALIAAASAEIIALGTPQIPEEAMKLYLTAQRLAGLAGGLVWLLTPLSASPDLEYQQTA